MLNNIINTTSKAKIVFISLTALYVVHALFRWLSMAQGRIATHFSTDGTPNDSMTGTGFALFHVAMAAFIVGIRWFLAASARWQQGINIPEYHTFTGEQKQVFAGFMALHSWSFGCLLVGMFLMIDGLIIWSNVQTPPNLPLVIGLVLTFVFLGGMGWWIIRLLTEVQSIKKAGTPTARHQHS